MNDCSKTIGWAEKTFNPITGCLGPKGDGKLCSYCYARGMAFRFGKTVDERAFKPIFHPERLDEPLMLRKPSRIFVGSMCDLFGDWVPDEWIESVYAHIIMAPQHAFYLLTKNPGRMREFYPHGLPGNIWLGTTLTCQADADERIPLLLSVPAVHRFISYEPALGPVDLAKWVWRELPWDRAGGPNECVHGYARGIPCSRCTPKLDWVIIGAQTGRGAAPIDPQWVASLTAQCDAANVAVYHKSSLAKYGFHRRDLP